MQLLKWLQELSEYPKIYWKERSQPRAFGAAGKIDALSFSYDWRFFSSTTAPHWQDFFKLQHPLHPHLHLEGHEGGKLPWKSVKLKERSTKPTQEEWVKLVDKTLKTIERKQLKKCVLARECLWDLEKPMDPWPLVAALEERSQNAYVICIQPTPRSAFISISPEKLFSQTKNNLHTEALAATQKIGIKTAFDLSHPKHTKEFSLVEESIQKALCSVSLSPLIFSSPSIRTTSGGLQHLYSQLEVKIKEGVSREELLQKLHPTAALSGLPKEAAFHFLQQHEPFERGLYGAPLGRITQEGSTWAVGIRSCLLFESTLRLYSGAGIVQGSDPLQEWNELDHKLSLFKEVLFHE